MVCKYCTKICKNENSLRNHERLCKQNPNRQVLKSNLIEYNEKVKRGERTASNHYIKAKKNGITLAMSDTTKLKISNKMKGRVLSEAHKQKLKKSMKLAVINNPESYSANNVSGRTPIIEYNGFYLKGSWELLVAKYLDKLGIKWTNIIDGISYEWNNSKHLYFPDFYLTDYDIYIEVKGYERERDRCKWSTLDNLIVLKKKEIELIRNDKYVLMLK